MTSALAFDIELDGDTILCASSAWTNGFLTIPNTWTSHNKDGFVPLEPETLCAFIMSLWKAHSDGVVLVTWGGTGSDWKILSAAYPDHADKIRQMALAAVDIPLISAASNGMMMGLTATAVGMGLGTRPSCDSEDVPKLWKTGEASKQNEVVNHVKWDAWACATIYSRLYILSQFGRPQLTWMTMRSGQRSVRLQRSAEKKNGFYYLPTVSEILTWDKPIANFSIPDHLSSDKMLEWLR